MDINRVAGLVEPLRSYNFIVRVLRAPVALPALSGLEFRAKRVTLPEQRFDAIEIPFRWYRWFVPGREAMDKSVEVVWWEGVDVGVYSVMRSWKEKVGDWFSGFQSNKEEISGDISVLMLDGRGVQVQAFQFRNAWIETLGQVELTYEDSRVVEVTATFRFDWFESGSGGGGGGR